MQGQDKLGAAKAGPAPLWRPAPLAPDSSPQSLLAGLALSASDAIAQRRLFVLLPFSLILGLIAYVALPGEPETIVLWGGVGAVLLAFAGAMAMQSLNGLRWVLQASAFWLGLCLLPIHGALFGTPMQPFPAYGAYEARVDEIISATPEQQRLVISQIVPLEGARAVEIRRARLVLPGNPPLAPGDRIRANLRLAPIPGPILPGSFDGQFHSYYAGIGSYGTVTSGLEKLAGGESHDLVRGVQALRSGIGARIDLVLSGESAAIGRAMVVGDQSAISDETREIMAASGLAHIYSISGLHLSIVAGGIFWLVRLLLASLPFALSWPNKKIAAIVGLVSAFLYLLLAGGPDNLPAFRSTLMLALIFGAVLAGRRALTMRNTAIAALIILLIDPAGLFRASFQLSFAAVVGLIGIYELPRTIVPSDNGRFGRFVGLVSATAWTSLIAGAATLLFSAYHFQQTAPLGVLGNVLALPFVSFIIMPFGVLSVLAMPFALDAPFLVIMGWGIDRMVDVARLVAGWSEGLTGNPQLATWTLLAGLAALAWFAFFNTRWRLLGPALAVPLVLVLGLEPRPDVLISDTTQAIAVRSDDGMALASGRTGSFAVDVWSQHYQTEIAATHPGARCDSLGCVVTTPEFSIAIIRSAAAFAEDCTGHDLVVARIRAPQTCALGGTLIAPNDLATGGVHWLKWHEGAGRFEVRPAIAGLTRPWRIAPR